MNNRKNKSRITDDGPLMLLLLVAYLFWPLGAWAGHGHAEVIAEIIWVPFAIAGLVLLHYLRKRNGYYDK